MSNKIRWISERLNRRTMTLITTSLTLVVGFGVFQGTKDKIILSVDGVTKTVRTHAKTVNQLLVEEGLKESTVLISPKKSTKVKDSLEVVVASANDITLTIDGEVIKARTGVKTVGEFLKENQIVLSGSDYVTPEVESKLEDGLNVLVNRSFPVTLQVQGKKQTVHTISTTVGDFLKAQNIKITNSDRVEPALHETVQKDFVVKVVNVQKVTDVVEESVKVATITKNDSSMEKGKKKVIQEGQEGKIKKTYMVVKEDGKEKTRKLVKHETILEALPKIIAVGLRNPSRGAESGREFLVEATAYSPYCNGCSGNTATGINIRKNPDMKLIAVDPDIIPLGSKVYVEGYGYAIAADTGGAIQGNRIDVLMPNESSAYRWGRKVVKIRVIK